MVNPPRLNPFLLVTMLTWGLNFVAVKVLFNEMEPPAVALSRLLFMWVALLGICKWKKISLRFEGKDLWLTLLQGLLSMGVYIVLFLEGIKRSGAAEGAILLGTGPIFTLLLAVLLGQERLTRIGVYGLLIAFSGVVLVTQTSDPCAENTLLGNGLLLTSAFVWASATVVSRPLLSRKHPLAMMAVSMPGALPVILPYSVRSFGTTPWGGLAPVSWAMLTYFCLVAGVVGFVLFYEGVSQVGAAGAMLYQYFVPPLAALSAWLVLGTPLRWPQVIGIGIVISGVWLATKRKVVPTPA